MCTLGQPLINWQDELTCEDVYSLSTWHVRASQTPWANSHLKLFDPTENFKRKTRSYSVATLQRSRETDIFSLLTFSLSYVGELFCANKGEPTARNLKSRQVGAKCCHLSLFKVADYVLVNAFNYQYLTPDGLWQVFRWLNKYQLG